MGWVDFLKGSIIGLDTAPLIYYTEQHPVYSRIANPFFDAMQDGEFNVVTSVISLLEVLVHPIRQKNFEAIEKYQAILYNTEGLETIDLSQQIAEEAARLRAFYKIQIADSVQMATAIKSNATYFLTNDLRLSSLPRLKVITLDELKTRPEYLEPKDLQ